MPDTQIFADIGRPRRIWAVGSIHGEVERLAALHTDIADRFTAGDRLVYLGNVLGRGPAVRETMDELLAFRRALLARPGMLAGDIVYLRGCQEEMWQKLLQLQFAPDPGDVLRWMLRQGVDATLRAYGGVPEQGLAAARDGAVALTRWTNSLRGAMRACPGHENVMSALRRAAFTSIPNESDGPRIPTGVLLVSAGIDISRPLVTQGDSFWWGGAGFSRIDHAYEPFQRLVRGYDPGRGGIQITDITTTLDGGCGFGGRLVCGCLTAAGDILEIVEV
jgi:hypothetical protein